MPHPIKLMSAAALLGLVGGAASLFVSTQVTAKDEIARTFTFCHTGGGTHCVVDGDTIWLDGAKIRIADIDAPETHPPRCEQEAELGNRATQRLHDLVNAGAFSIGTVGSRTEDRYGRALRVLTRNGQVPRRHPRPGRAGADMDGKARTMVPMKNRLLVGAAITGTGQD